MLSRMSLSLLLVLAAHLSSCSAAAAESLNQQQLYGRGLVADSDGRGLEDDSLVHQEFGRRFTKRSLSTAVDEIFDRLMREEEECRQQEEQCDNTDDQVDGGGEGAGGGDESANIVAPPTKPDTNDQDHGGQGQGHGGGQDQGQGQGEGQGQGGGGGSSTNEEAAPGKSFYIESEFSGKVLEITPGVKPVEGAKVQMWDKRGSRDLHQLWVVGEDKFIRSALERGMEFSDSSKENRLLDALRDVLNGRVPGPGLRQGNNREGDLSGLEMHPLKSHYKGGRWKWNGAQITNEAGYALTIRDASKDNGARLIQHGTDPEAHKKWRAVYV